MIIQSLLYTAVVFFSASCAQTLPPSTNDTGRENGLGETQTTPRPLFQWPTNRTPEYWDLMWRQAMIWVAVVSLAPLLISLLIPISQKRGYVNRLRVLLAFALGKRLMDFLFLSFPRSLYPGGFKEVKTDKGIDYKLQVILSLGFLAFFLVEKFIQYVSGKMSGPLEHESRILVHFDVQQTQEGGENPKTEGAPDDVDPEEPQAPIRVQVGAYLNLAAYFVQNFTLALEVGAKHAGSFTAGVMGAVSITFHKVPHDIGGFGILVQNGMTKRQALGSLLLTNSGTLAGTIVGFYLGPAGVPESVCWSEVVLIGGFCYLGLVAAVPELFKNWRFWQKVMQILALLFGALFMFVPM